MYSDWIYQLGDRAFAAAKWAMTLLIGFVTTTVILILES